MKKIVVIGALSFFAAVSHAEEAQPGGWYAGLAYSALDAELSAAGLSGDSEPNAINLVVGHEFNKHFAVEGLLGRGVGEDSVENASFDFELKSVIGVSAVGILPLSDTFSFYGKVGVAQVKYDDSDGDSSDGSGVMFGIGAALDLNEQFGINLEYVQYPDAEYDDFDIDVEANALSLGVSYSF